MIANYFPKKCFLFGMLIVVLQLSCQKMDGYNTVVSADTTKPDPVSDVKVSNFSGGAYITYTLPKSKNILYVQAEYKINDIATRQTKSSYYSDTIKVDGFAKSDDYEVVLHVVSRANVISEPVIVTVHPGTPPYLTAFESLVVTEDFGGVNIKVSNDEKANIGVVTLLPDSITNRYKIINQNYTNADLLDYTLRGYDTRPKQFAFYVTDPFGNTSDTLYSTIHPIFEELLNKSLFQRVLLASDVSDYNGSFGLPNLWNGNNGELGYNTAQPITTVTPFKPFIWPAWMTFDMGQTAKLSRHMMWFRAGANNEFVWTAGAPQQWIIWGRDDTPVDELMPTDVSQLPAVGEKTPQGWVNMGVFTAPPRPANNPLTSADINTWNAGFSFSFSIDLPPVRYIRFECLHNMGGTDNFFNINEISVFGNTNL